MPTLISSLPAAWAFRALPAARTAPVAADLRKLRRLGDCSACMRRKLQRRAGWGGWFWRRLLVVVIPALPVHRRQEVLQFYELRHRPDHAEADEIGVGHPPDALRPLGIPLQPGLVRPAAGGAAAAVGRVGPRPAADHVGVLERRRLADRVAHRAAL